MPQALVARVTKVEDFPGRNDLNVNHLSNGAICVSNREVAGGASRYQVDDLVIHVPAGLIAPDWLLKRQGCWNESKDKGTLKGSKGNRTCDRTFKIMDGDVEIGQKLSEGMLLACDNDFGNWSYENLPQGDTTVTLPVVEGQNVTEVLGLSVPSN